ncbi:MAG: nucleotidyltransferase family protein [Mesorhizobium sp.]|uniref:sugar phosphate nucleotidyltransferase n=1 Tax=unclassified Mesorhizobium TaxID=325217 RepID=UPI000F754237|nr:MULTISPECIES: sugar phosphate nucleotidyltransferase [unclassified Mesorhizobium]AZO53504.1 nucleotidyltransferase family protein [Mesorhizobium sp. M8A.F.Ca.ET.057.01.1.1]RWE43202.1 MAG: nucleotidyltransferase family protein [Mesorhizobium sp.]RWE44475.1 MAG: nucleotidyltransferase family protein [Mesorhizobium sp.]
MLGIVPAAGRGSRIQPLGFSKELLPVGSRRDGETERPCAVSEYLVRRMVLAGVDKLCFIIGPGKSDILEYYAAGYGSAAAIFVVQPTPVGLCDAIFRAAPLVPPDEMVLVGLPDTIWFPEDGFCHMADDRLSFLLFPVERPEFFDAVLLDPDGRVVEIQVKQQGAGTNWVWGAFKMPGRILHQLEALWRQRNRSDEYIGTLINAFLSDGGEAYGVKAGAAYVDVGTLNGYRTALQLLDDRKSTDASLSAVVVSSSHVHVPIVPGEGA